MRRLLRSFAVAWLPAMALPVFAATPTEFYLNLLRRGTADVETGQYQRGINSLRIAAFGLVDSIEHYQTAQVYLAVAADRLEVEAAAGEAVRRVVLAQRIEPRYALLRLPEQIRSAFEAVARKTLGPGDSAALFAGPSAVRSPTGAGNPAGPAAAPTTVVTPPAAGANPATARPEPPPVAASKPPAAPARSEPSASSPTTSRPASKTEPPAKPAEVKTADTEGVEATVHFDPAPSAPASSSQEPDKTVDQTPAKKAPDAVPTAGVRASSEGQAPAVPPPAQAAAAKPPAPRSDAPVTTPAKTAEAPRPATTRQVPQPIRVDPVPVLDPTTLQARLADASKALAEARLLDARVIYRALLADPALRRDAVLLAGEGLYRARDFAGALEAFGRIGEFRKGEEPYRYYVAVALYETGQYSRAKEELAAALPFIELTPDVVRYRAKIEGSIW